MQTIKVKSVEIKEGVAKASGKPYKSFIIHGEDGSSASTFDATASSIRSGDTIEAEIELKGKYANIKSFKVASSNGQTREELFPETPKPITFIPKTAIPQPLKAVATESDKDKSISEAVAIKAVVELAVGKVIEPNHSLITAVKSWCSDKLRNYLSTLPPEAIKAPVIVPGKPEVVADEGCGIDMTFLKEIMGKLGWTPAKAASWIENRFPPLKRKGTLSDTINLLTKEQKAEFVQAISELAAPPEEVPF